MAENRKYKYKTDEIDSELFKKNLLSNYESYVKYQGYKDDELSQFKASFDNYLKALDQGTLSTGYDGSVTDTSGSLKNEGFDQHVAKYFNVIGNAVNQKTTKKAEQKKTKFSLDEHGFWNAFGKHIAPSGTGDLDAWLNQDAYDEVKKTRGIENRVTHFNNFLDQYIKNFGDYDFEGTSFKSKEDYLGRLQKVREALSDNTLSDNEHLLLNQAGLDPKMYKAAFATTKTYTDPTQAASDAEALKQKQEYEAWLKQIKADYDANPYHALDYHTGTYKALTIPETQQIGETDLNTNAEFMLGKEVKNKDWHINYLVQNHSQDITEGIYKGWKSIAPTYDSKSKTIMVINPTTHQYKRAFIGDVNDYFHGYIQQYQNKKDPDSWMKAYNYAVYNKEGGKFQEGGNIDYKQWVAETLAKEKQKYQEGLSKRAKASGNTEEYQKSMERHVFSGSENASDPESTGLNFSTEDYFDLGALAADIYSGLSDPITGTVAGVASSLTNFGTDLSRGKGVWDATKELGTNLAFDAISIIPVFGDAVGSGGKVVKKLAKWAPKILTALSTGRMIAGLGPAYDGIKASLEKIGKEGKENELTSQDFKNILSGLNMIIQGGKGLSSAYSKRKATKMAEMPDNVDVRVTQNGQQKVLRFSGDEAKHIKTLKTPEEVKNFITEKHKSYKDIEIQTKSDGTGGGQWIWSRDKGNGTKRSFWDLDNFRSPYKSSGQVADISTVDYDKLRRTQFDYRWGRHLRSGNNNVDRVGARGLGTKGQDLFSVDGNVEIIKPARVKKPKPKPQDNKPVVDDKPDYFYDSTEAFWDKQGGSLILKAQEGTELVVANGKMKRLGKGTSEDPYRFVNIDGTEVGSNIVADGKLKRVGSGTTEDPYRFVNNDESESAVDANYQNPVITNEQFLPKKEDILKHLDKLQSKNDPVTVNQYEKKVETETEPVKENPLSGIKTSKILRLAKFAQTLNHNKKQEELALARPVRQDQVAELTETPVVGQYGLNNLAEKQAAQLMNTAVNTSTTDSAVNREMQLKAAIAGNEIKMKQAVQEDAAIATARAKNAEIQNKNKAARVENANLNNAYALKKMDDDYAAKSARMSADNLSYINFIDDILNKDVLPKEAEYDEAKESVKMQNYQTEILKNPSAHGLQFDAATTKLVQDIANKTRKASDLSPEEYANYEKALAQINQMIKVKMARDRHLTLNFNPTPIETPFTATVTGMQEKKDGGKITVAKIKKKIEKAKLQQRQLEDRMKNYQKDLDRLSKRPDTYKKEK